MSIDTAPGPRPDGPPAAGPASAQLSLRRILPPVVTGQEIVLLAVIVVLWVLLGIFTPAFLTPGSIGPLLVQVAPIALVGVGMTFVIITAGIDVSVAAMIMVSAVTTARMLVAFDIPVIAAVLVAIVIGAALGALNGILIAYGRVHPIIITFGTANVFLFIGLQIFGSTTVNGIPATFDVFGRGEAGRTLGIPHAFAITVLISALAWWYLRHTAGGRRPSPPRWYRRLGGRRRGFTAEPGWCAPTARTTPCRSGRWSRASA